MNGGQSRSISSIKLNKEMQMLQSSSLKQFLSAYSGKCKFYDLSTIEPAQRKAKSPVIQFYSSINNIGNFTPVLGIQQMLGMNTDTWCMHDKSIDFDFINRHYQCAIIGGAGLLNKCFEPFWQKAAQECQVPMIIWGVGTCFPDDEGAVGVSRALVTEIASRCDLINVRDDLTAEYYGLENPSITACPTIAFLQKFQRKVDKNPTQVLFSSHEELVSSEETEQIQALLGRLVPDYKYTNNLQRRFTPLNKIISQSYCKSRVVVTTRLHGAIIAYGLGVPYIAIPRDEKLRAFHRLYGNGASIERVSDLGEALHGEAARITQPIALAPVLEFGDRARDWVKAVGVATAGQALKAS
jgi:Polysaccharide pyruvyl transferase